MIFYKKRKFIDGTKEILLSFYITIVIALMFLKIDKIKEILLISIGIILIPTTIYYIINYIVQYINKEKNEEMRIKTEKKEKMAIELSNKNRLEKNLNMKINILYKYNNDKYIFVEKYDDTIPSEDVLNNYIKIDTSKIRNIIPLTLEIQEKTYNMYLKNKDYELVDCYRIVYNEYIDTDLKHKTILIYEKK